MKELKKLVALNETKDIIKIERPYLEKDILTLYQELSSIMIYLKLHQEIPDHHKTKLVRQEQKYLKNIFTDILKEISYRN